MKSLILAAALFSANPHTHDLPAATKLDILLGTCAGFVAQDESFSDQEAEEIKAHLAAEAGDAKVFEIGFNSFSIVKSGGENPTIIDSFGVSACTYSGHDMTVGE